MTERELLRLWRKLQNEGFTTTLFSEAIAVTGTLIYEWVLKPIFWITTLGVYIATLILFWNHAGVYAFVYAFSTSMTMIGLGFVTYQIIRLSSQFLKKDDLRARR